MHGRCRAWRTRRSCTPLIKTGKRPDGQITDGMSNVTNPIFDANGKYIYFTASTDIGPAIDGFGLGSLNRTTTASVYIAVLSKDEKSPIPPESDDERDKADADKKPAATDDAKSDEKKDAAKESDAKKDKDKKKAEKPAPETKIDLEGHSAAGAGAAYPGAQLCGANAGQDRHHSAGGRFGCGKRDFRRRHTVRVALYAGDPAKPKTCFTMSAR